MQPFPYVVFSPLQKTYIDEHSELFRENFVRYDHPRTVPADAKYLLVVYLWNIWALHPPYYQEQSASQLWPYILDQIETEAGEDFRNGRCYVVLDLSHEAHPFIAPAFDSLHDWCDRKSYPIGNMALVSGNRILPEHYNRAYPDRAEKLTFLSFDYYTVGIAERFALDEPAFEEAFGFPKDTQPRTSVEGLEHWYLCLNAAPRAHRVATLAALSHLGLLPRTLWSLLKGDAAKIAPSMDLAQGFLQALGLEERLLPHAAAILDGPPRYLDQRTFANSNELAWTVDGVSYDRTYLSIVTETMFAHTDVVWITEKLLKALSMGQPSIVVGNTGSLELARSFGFQTFDPLIDESYDTIDDPAARFAALMNAITGIDGALKRDPAGTTGPLNEIARFNLRHARDGGFLRTYHNTVTRPLVEHLVGKMSQLSRADRNGAA